MATRMQQRRGTAEQWTSANPILAAGEIGFESDSGQFKIGDGVNHWADLSYFKNLEDLGGNLDDYLLVTTRGAANGVASLDGSGQVPLSQLSNLIDGAPSALNTLRELAAAVDNNASFASSIISSLSSKISMTELNTHNSNTLNVHGIANTANLATTSYVLTQVGDAIDGEETARNNAIQDALETASADATTKAGDALSSANGYTDTSLATAKTYADNAVSTHSNDTTSVHGIADTSVLVTSSQLSDHATDTTNIHGITDTAALATKTYADNAVSTHEADTTSVHGIADTSKIVLTTDSGTVTSTMIANGTIVDADINASAAIAQSKVSGLTSDLAAKAPLAGPTFTGTVVLPSTTSIGNVSATEIGYVDGVTSAIQTQLDAKLASSTAASTYAPIASPTFTGTVAGVTKSMVGLGNVDNTSDANKPVSTATQTALDGKLALSGGTLTGSLTLSGAPTSDLHAATKAYVDGVSAGINFHQAVVAATSGNLAGVYDNGTSGYGATITASANGAIGTIDGATVSVGSRILLRAQTDATQNGIYTVTNVGGASAKWVVTRAADADNNPAGELATGDFCFVTGGNTYPNTGFILSTSGTITIGTTSVNYTQFNAAQAITAGSGLTKTGSTLSIGTGAITSDMILDGTIATADIADAAVTTAKHADSSITTVKIADSAITSAKIADGTIVDADINASAAIAKTKISGTAITAADTGTVTSTMILDGTIVDADINASAAIAQSKISGLSTSLGLKANLAAPSFTGGVTVDSSGVIFTDGTQTKAGVPSITAFATAIASSATLGAGQQDKFVPLTGAVTITLPATGYSTGQSIDFYQESGTGAAFASTNGVVGTPGLKLRTTYSVATAMKTTSGWLVFGDLSA
jgi:hypothetical protein